jgi:hypothetical protein
MINQTTSDEVKPYRDLSPKPLPDCECVSCVSREVSYIPYGQRREVEASDREHRGLI